MSHFSYEQLRLLAQCSSAVVVAALLAYGLLPQLRAHKALQAQVTHHQQKLAGPIVQPSDLSDLAAQNAALSADLGSDQPVVQPRELESRVLAQLHAKATSAGVRLASVLPQRELQEEDMLVMRFEVEAVGTYGQCANWLEALDHPDSMVVLDAFALEPEDPQGARLRAKSKVVSYHQSPGKPS